MDRSKALLNLIAFLFGGLLTMIVFDYLGYEISGQEPFNVAAIHALYLCHRNLPTTKGKDDE